MEEWWFIKGAQIIFGVLLEHLELIKNIVILIGSITCILLYIVMRHYSKENVKNDTKNITKIGIAKFRK